MQELNSFFFNISLVLAKYDNYDPNLAEAMNPVFKKIMKYKTIAVYLTDEKYVTENPSVYYVQREEIF